MRKPVFLEFPDLQEMGGLLLAGSGTNSLVREMMRSYRIRINARIGQGDVDGALDDLESSWLLARHVKQQPNLIKLMVGIVIAENTIEEVQNLIRYGNLNEAQLARLETILANNESIDRKRLYECETIGSAETLQALLDPKEKRLAETLVLMSAFDDSGIGDILLYLSVYVSIDRNVFRAGVFRQLRDAKRIIEETDPSRRRESEERFLESQARQVSSSLRWLTVQSRSRFLGTVITSQYFQGGIAILKALDRCDARVQLARAAVWAERYRLKNGQYPDQLPSERLFDPCTGKPTISYRLNPQSKLDWERELVENIKQDPEYRDPRYNAEESPYYRPYILYSFGPNQTDEGAKRQFPCRDADGEDLIW